MSGGDQNGGTVTDDEKEVMAHAIEAAQRHVHALEVRLEELRRQLLARGTRDVLDEAEDAVKRTAHDAIEVIEEVKKTN